MTSSTPSRSVLWRAAVEVLAPTRRAALRLAALVLCLLLFVGTLAHSASGGGWKAALTTGWYGIYVTGWMLLASLTVRTLSLRNVVAYWLIGFFPVVFVVYISSLPAGALFGTANEFTNSLWVPLVEETGKALPLVAFVLFFRRDRTTPAISDLLILGFVLGAAFGFHEDLLKSRLVAGGFGGDLYGVLFPTFLRRGGQFAVTHGGWTALVGLGMGIAVVYRRHRIARLVPLVMLAFVFLDHASINYTGWGEGVLSTVAGDGHRAAELLVLGTFGALIHDGLVLWWAGRRDDESPPISLARHLRTLGRSDIATRFQVLAELRYRRYRNALHFELWHLRDEEAADRTEEVRTLDAYARVAGLGSVWKRARRLAPQAR